MIYVLDKDNFPLMPTSRYGKVRHLLKDKKATIVKRNPFTIKLLYESKGFTQPITLGVDSGSKIVGLSATTERQELLASEVVLRNDIVDLLTTKRQNRRTRRNRLRYREPRFLNRAPSKKKGWLAPSVKHKIETHLTVVNKVYEILPITKIVVETASFDIQKLNNPDISGKEYQQGDQLGFWNVREYVLYRDNHVCQLCKGKSKDRVLHVHHIVFKRYGGTDKPSNLITLCNSCHTSKNHKEGHILYKWCQDGKKVNNFKDATFMGIMRWSFYNKLKDTYIPLGIKVENTYGYLTKNKRIDKGLPKEHCIDAYCIANNLGATLLDSVLIQKKVRCHNRQIHKANILKGGRRKLNQAKYIVKGFRLFDKVVYKGQECFITGRRTTGYFALKTIKYVKVHDGARSKDLQLIEARGSFIAQNILRE